MAMERSQEPDATSKLSRSLPRDALAAAMAAVAVAPIMTIIDRAVMEAAAGHTSVLRSMRYCLESLMLRPHQFVSSRPFGVMLVLYSGTYITANAIDTMTSVAEDLPANTTTSTATKFGVVTSINLILSLCKDSCFARAFGDEAVRKRALPAISYAPLIIRDGITLYATFNAPVQVAGFLPEEVEGYASRLSIAQVACPAASQFVATPLHLLGVDLYYRNGRVPWRDRVDFIKRTWWSSSVARAFRVIPAFGMGGIVNTQARSWLMEGL